LLGLSRSVAHDYGRLNITSNSISPGPIWGDLSLPQPVENMGWEARLSPLGRSATYEDIAKILLTDVVAIFQSRSEQGQRGLGNRSLLISPILKNSFDKLNKIKKREYYRPFACSVLQENAKENEKNEWIIYKINIYL
jgi:predicted NodU family carbamoyl transferase